MTEAILRALKPNRDPLPSARHGFIRGHGRYRAPEITYDGLREGMGGFTSNLNQSRDQLLRRTTHGFGCCHFGFTLGERSGFIKGNHFHIWECFKGLDILDQDPVLGGETSPCDQRGWGGQTQRAWTSNHQHADRSNQRIFQSLTNKQPNPQCQQRKDKYRRDKDTTDAINQLLDRCFAHLSIFDQCSDLRDCGCVTNPFCTDTDGAVDHQGPRYHRIPRDFIFWDRFAGHRGGIDLGVAFDDDSIGSDAFATSDDENIT